MRVNQDPTIFTRDRVSKIICYDPHGDLFEVLRRINDLIL
jgi:hypothetical protein